MGGAVSRSSCLVCGGVYGDARLPGLLQCTSCGFVTANLLLSRTDLERLYSLAYFTGDEYYDYLGERGLIERHFAGRLRVLSRYVGDRTSKALFEVGCAFGFFLNVARREFASVAGIDISTEATSYAKDHFQLDVVAGDFATAPITGQFDVVCMWDTIEHVAHPERVVQRAAELLRPGGHVAITTGDIGSVVARWRGSKWRQIHPPTHLHYFSRQTLTHLLERHGFTVRYAGYDGMYRSVETMAWIVLTIKHRRPKVFSALKRTGLLNWSLYINLFDIMYLIAEKTDNRAAVLQSR